MKTLLLVAGAALTAGFFAWQWLPAALSSGQPYPVGHDAFYHAQRILSAVETGWVLQFDPRIHAPEGSLLTWPWAYDLAMAWWARAAISFAWVSHPLTAVIFVPTAAIILSAWMLHGIAASLGLPTVLRFFVLACFACSPLTQSLHGVGAIDHHFVEYLFVLAVSWSMLTWIKRPDDARWAVIVGLLAGIAPAFHNSLFIIQLPIVMSFGLSWIRGEALGHYRADRFAAALGLGLIIAAAPSQALHEGRIDYFTLSWFHVFAASATGSFVYATCRLQATRKTIGLTILACLVFVLALGRAIFSGFSWLSSDVQNLDRISETQSLASALALDGIDHLLTLYSGLLLGFPIVVAFALFFVVRTHNPATRYFLCVVIIGSALMFSQLRLHYFGSFALYVPLAMAINHYWPKWRSGTRWQAILSLALLFALTHQPVLARLMSTPALAGDREYALVSAVYPWLKQQCNAAPGIVLADPNDGHHITYHSECSVVANMMIITPQHEEKMRTVDALFELPLSQLREAAPYLKYVYVWDDRPFYRAEVRNTVARSGPLTEEILSLDNPPPPQLGVKILVEMEAPGGGPLFLRVIELL